MRLLQGALDGGLDIPHNEKRFVGWTKEDGLEAEVIADLGQHLPVGIT